MSAGRLERSWLWFLRQITRLLPAAFRRQWGDELLDTLEARLHERVGEYGRRATVAFALREASSLLVTVLSTHLTYGRHSTQEAPMMLQPNDNRPYRIAWACALGFHFLLFVAVFPSSEAASQAETPRTMIVIRSVPPPPPDRPKTPPVRRDARRVPIPDPDPFDPEPFVDDALEMDVEIESERPDLEFTVTPPQSPPTPARRPAIAGVNVQRPSLVHRVQPRYPSLARRARLECAVVLEARIDPNGRVVDVRVVKSCGLGLDEAALEAVQQWRYAPTLINGHAVEVVLSVRVDFRLQ